MKNVIAIAVASAALASAQVTSNPDGTFTCATPDKNYCAGSSLGTDIIIRCSGTKGQPGRCTDNLAGEPPVGVQPALCWQSSPTSGDAACEKNCIVYAATGSFSLPNCTPSYTAPASSSTSSTPSTTTATTWGPGYGWGPGASTGSFTHPYPPSGTWTSTWTSATSTAAVSTMPTMTTTSKSTTVPTAGAASNGAAGALAMIGAVAAYLL